MSGATIAVLVPVVSRGHHAEPFMDSIRLSGASGTDWQVYPICDEGDPAAAIWATHAGRSRIMVSRFNRSPGSFAEKVNYGYRHTSEPWIYVVGSDVRFHPWWFRVALSVAERSGCDVVGTNDLVFKRVSSGVHAHHMLIRRSYVDRWGASWDGPGIVCHEGYKHWYVDDEIVAVACERYTFVVALGSVVEHMHPFAGKAAMDEVYALGQSFEEVDGNTFTKRKLRYALVHQPEVLDVVPRRNDR